MSKTVWSRLLYDGIYQFIAEDDEGNVIETGRDVIDAPCRELWSWIRDDFPTVDNYRGFCACYRAALSDRQAHFRREDKRQKKFWGE